MTRLLTLAARRSLLCALLLAMSVPMAWADPTGPTTNDQQVAKVVTMLLRRQHLLRHPLDAEISQRALKSFLKTLDPWKLYFNQSDIDEFMKSKDDLSEQVKKGDLNFAYTVFKTYLKRVDERVQLTDELLAMKHDFTVDEEMVTDKDAAEYAKTPADAKEKWRKRIKYDLLMLKVEKTEGKEALDKLQKRYHSYSKRMHQTDNDELLEMYLTAMTTSLDPHTDYMSPFTLDNFEKSMSLKLEGIGAALQSVDGTTVVNKLIPGGAAEKDGRLKIEDQIVGVGQGENAEIVDTVDMKLTDVVKLIRGKPGTVVRLAVISVGSPEKKIINITRASIELKDSEARSQIFEEGRKPDGTPYKIGVIDLPSFYMDMEGARRGLPDFKSTTRDVKLLLNDFTKKGVDSVVLDLRRNGGGSLTEAINLTGLFLTDGPVVQVKDADGKVQPYYDLDSDISWSGPLVVVISKFSASASEILAGAIQDYGRGLIVGDHSTHGKGTVQSLMELGRELFQVPNAPSMGALKVTIQQFYRPLGESTQKRGVLADVELPSLTTHLDVGETDLDYPIPFGKVDPLTFKKFNYVTQPNRDQLKKLSEERCDKSEKFQQVRKNIERYDEQKSKKTVTLNEEKFLKERSEMNAEKEEEKKIEELDSKKVGIERDYYLAEVMAIAADFLNLSKPAAKASVAGSKG
jgi:carboxyl-terminal processing protease